MPHITTILGNEAGIQYQGVKDASSVLGVPLINGLIVGQFKRGRLDRPMTITLENIRGTLGHDPNNPDYIAVMDALAAGVPSVQVMRVGESGSDAGGDGGDGGDGGGTGGDGGGTGGDGGGDGGGEQQEPLWDIKYKVNGAWVYEVTGPVVEISVDRNMQYRELATELVVSDRVTEVGYMAFRYWDALVSVNLGNTVTRIGAYAFESCTKLRNIDLSNSLEVVGDNSFGDCYNLEVLDFGENLQTINSWALVNLYKLHTIVFRSNTLVTLGSNVFGNGSSNDTNPQHVYVPDNLRNEYYLANVHILGNLGNEETYKPLSQYTG